MQVIDLRKERVSNRKLKDACLAVYQDLVEDKSEDIYSVYRAGYPYSITGRDNMGTFGVSISRSVDQTIINEVTQILEKEGMTFVDVEVVFTMSAMSITGKDYLRVIDEDGDVSDLMFFGFSEIGVIAMKDGKECRLAVTDYHIGKNAVENEEDGEKVNAVERARFIMESSKDELVLLNSKESDPYFGTLAKAERYEETIAKTFVVEGEYISDIADEINPNWDGDDANLKLSAVLLSAPDGILQFLELPKEEPYVMPSVSTTLQ